jgi:hypothetical protein
MKKYIMSAVRITLSLALLALIFSRIDIQNLLDHIKNLNLGLYLLGVALYFGFIACWSFRWRYIIKASGEQVALWKVFKTTLVGDFFGLFLPEAVGSDLARMYGLSRETGKGASTISTVLLDRAIGLISLSLMAMVALLLHTEMVGYREVAAVVIFLLAGLAGGWFLFFNKSFMRRFRWVFKIPYVDRLENGLTDLYRTLHNLHQQPGLILNTLLISLALQIVEVLSVVLIGAALGMEVEVIHYFIYMPLIWVITTVPISIGGLGVRENAFAFFFRQVGVSSPLALALSLLYFSCRVISGLIGGLIFLVSMIGEQRKPEAQARTTA